MRSPVQAHLSLDLDLALLDLEEYGPSPGGQTELRYMAASSATAGEDVEAWPEDWILEGPPSWWSSVEDPAYAEHLLLSAGDHFARQGPPTAFPTVPMDPDDPIAAEAYTLESIALTYHLEETYGRDRLIDLVGRLIVLDQRHDEGQIEQAYREALGSDRDELLDGFARWTQTLSTVDEESETSVPGR